MRGMQMSKTNDLRLLIKSKLITVCSNVYYEIADEKAMYPHIVYSFTFNENDLSRDDITIEFDVWDKSDSAVQIENLCDSIEKLFNNENSPQETILPTFYRIDRKKILDEDKAIRHRLIRIMCQNYDKED
jgi:hypothetical protein